ncbi:MAG: bacterial transcriptional activator domain-containing protein, partial [Acidobacteriota bacterium]
VEAFVDHANRGDALARGDGRAADRSGSSAGESGNAVTGGVSDDALIAWTEAWRLYRGPLMAGYDGALIEHRRAELHRRYLDVLRSIGDAYDARGRTTEALDAYRTILIDEPYEEAVHVAVMAQYATLGRRDLVRRQYLRLTALLSELGVAPSEPTQRRYHGWMGHDPG